MKGSQFHALLASLFVLGLTYYSMAALRPPRGLPADAPAGEFSAHRAIQHAFACSQETHPAGSKNNERVAEYILGQLQEMGVEAEYVKKPAIHGNHIQLRKAVIGRIPGKANTGAIAFSAHYDSVPYGPGATDDIGGCIAMLETARAFMNLPRMNNDLLFVFTDAEEMGGYGAAGFCEHPLAKNIGIMNELDVRGTGGPALIYETSSDNGALIAELRKARSQGAMPVSSSLMFAVYEASPFGSDFTKFRNVGMKGYNVAYINKFLWYHTMNDSPAHISPESIQHFGAHAMGIGKHFGNLDFSTINLATQNDVYFNTLGFHMVQYPMSLNAPLAAVAIVLLVLVIVAGLFLRRVTVGGYLVSLLLFPTAAIPSAILACLMLAAVFGWDNMLHLYTVKFTYIPEPRAFYFGNYYCGTFALMAIAVTGLVYVTAARRLRAENLHAAALTWFCPALVVAVLYFPGGSYVMLWPLFFGTLGLALLYCCRRHEGPGPLLLLLSTLFATPALCLAPGWQTLMWMINILGAPLLAMLTVVILLALMPLFSLLSGVPRIRALFGTMAVVALLLLGAGLVLNTPSKDRPDMDSVSYAANLDTGEAWWVSEDVAVDEWTRQFFPEEKRTAIDDIVRGKHGSHYLRNAAPVAAHLRGVRCDVLADEAVDGKRAMTLRLFAEDAPFHVNLRQTAGPQILSAELEGVALRADGNQFSLDFDLFSDTGYVLKLTAASGEPIVFEAYSQIYGFPEIPGIAPRPEHIVPEPNTMRNGISLRSQHMFVRNSFTVAALPSGPAI